MKKFKTHKKSNADIMGWYNIAVKSKNLRTKMPHVLEGKQNGQDRVEATYKNAVAMKDHLSVALII